MPVAKAEPRAGRAGAAATPLQPIFAGVGSPADLRALGGAIVRMQMQLFGPEGAVLADLPVLHWVDLGAPRLRDRLELSGDGAARRVYGRQDGTVFAQMFGLAFAELTEQAAEELEVFGLLLRMPWAFDGPGFVVEDPQPITVAGVRRIRVRVTRRQPPAAPGGTGKSVPADRFDLICNATSRVPEELHMTLGRRGKTVRVVLSDYATLGRIRLPMRRTFLGSAGEKVMELRIVAVDHGQQLGDDLFRPRR
ncbi:MAG: hypothetical protein H6837_07145 [Planctomycetes bacterium]|nr:hypothetical protein [Planctomycetota bacterium]